MERTAEQEYQFLVDLREYFSGDSCSNGYINFGLVELRIKDHSKNGRKNDSLSFVTSAHDATNRMFMGLDTNVSKYTLEEAIEVIKAELIKEAADKIKDRTDEMYDFDKADTIIALENLSVYTEEQLMELVNMANIQDQDEIDRIEFETVLEIQ